MKPNWKNIILFTVLAMGISIPFHLGLFEESFQAYTNGGMISDWGYLLAGIGPLLAALFLLAWDPSISNRISIFGDEKLKNILIASLPILTFPIFGLENPYGINTHFYAFIYALINVIYAFFEEFGWRRYLQNALEGINKNGKYILIGLVWWIWHMRFETSFDLFVFPIICIGGAYLLGKLADDTKSILPIVNMHALIILLTNSGAITMNKMIGLALTIIGWFIIEQYWKRKKAAPS